MHNVAWTEEECSFLRANHRRIPASQIAQELDRPIGGIWNKAYKLGLSEKHSVEQRTDGEAGGYLIGVLLGDGCLSSQPQFILTVRDRDFAEDFRDALKRSFGFKYVGLRYTERNKCFTVSKSNKDLINFLLTASDPEWILQQEKAFKVGVLKGLWDSEGTIYLVQEEKRSPNYPRVRFGICDYDIANLYRSLLYDVLHIRANILGPYGPSSEYWVQLSGYKKAQIFFEKVGSNIRRKRERFERALKEVGHGS